MRLKHVCLTSGMQEKRRVSFAGAAVLAASLNFGCSEPKAVPVSEPIIEKPAERDCSTTDRAREVMGEIHNKIAANMEGIRDTIGAEPRERVELSFSLELNGDGTLDARATEAMCGVKECSGGKTVTEALGIEEIKVPEGAECDLNFHSIIEPYST